MFRLHFIILAFLAIPFFCKADIIFTQSSGRILLEKGLSVLNPEKELNLSKVIKSQDFRPVKADVPNIGVTQHSVWVKFTINNQSDDAHLLLDLSYPRLDEVELITLADGKIIRKLISSKKGFSQRPYKTAGYIFPLDIPKGQTKTYYLRVKGQEHIFIPLYLNHEKEQILHTSRDNVLSGIYLGIVLIMVLYNLFIYLSVKDRSYVYYVVYVLFAGLTQFGLKGYNFQYLWPGSPHFDSLSITLFACISGIAALLFSRKFLDLTVHYKKFSIVLLVFTGLFIISLGILSTGRTREAFQLMQLNTSISSVGVFYISLFLLIKGHRGAKFFFSAWSVLLTGALIFLLKDYGIFPYNTFTINSVQAASAIEMALLSFGLADRINILKKEKELSQAEALRVANENARIIREQNVMLENKVNERTLELKESNEELNVTLENLKQAQSQLVESEKMASLGQLTAGIAHEINNPINFVTSNVNPLKRDFDLLLETITQLENTALSEDSIPEKQKSIDELKEELDFDYLKIEISHLLKGIHEGASRTAEIVKGLRIFSRVDEDDLKSADVIAGLESTLVIINNLLNNRIRIIKKYSEMPLVECYPGKLNQVFLNILTNAIHAINKRYGENTGGEIRISTSYNEESVFITIEDNGTGMDENTKKKIFDPFFTTKDVGEGTGLGMSIAYNTINKHKGQIIVNSAPGQGTGFTLQLPLRQ
ncbi:sensor histidine kinase [Pararcticibacter amylolyticus]|uniref:histidine kinase n=1 Tax=Pararcticibacter amylolyticus TaxID=2173175 RepID=A0A2U2PM70_9SPHI|nr:7TM diverse intracellular signaling domain-containing protein [Pararcticibacter amylolyticus]PWG82490.1 histidine kinase [Pararcticibacter amylolyticus]